MEEVGSTAVPVVAGTESPVVMVKLPVVVPVVVVAVLTKSPVDETKPVVEEVVIT